ncbi:MAG: hypothetical protein IJR90_07020 [Clostridia bacterium]|nr:hypothetical protein [Clostridia bacterium]
MLWKRLKAGILCALFFVSVFFAGLLFMLAIFLAGYYESLWWLLLWLGLPVPMAVGIWAIEKTVEK